MKKKMYLFLTGIVLAAAVLTSCKKTSGPTAEIFSTVAGYTVTFNPQVTDADTYSWDFGDGSALSTDKNPVHTYESFGDYTVKLTVKGEGGEKSVTKVISIAATSIKDLLTGGIKATTGKTWVLDRAYTVGDGGGPVSNTPYTISFPSIDNALDMFGLGDEYDNEFTFYYDGTYKVNPKNGNVLAAAVYSSFNGIVVGEPAWAVGLCAATWTAPASATWTHGTSDFTIDAIGNPDDSNVPPAHAIVTFTGQNWITFSTGAYFGIFDFPTITKFIIDELTPNKMRVSLFLCGYGFDGGDAKYNAMPTNMLHLSYIKK
ncbi:MAG: PKD domain-containing protein [Bacteroidia bacterium]|nr:PKD domain-containing protein [Bacteroidia bacterium]